MNWHLQLLEIKYYCWHYYKNNTLTSRDAHKEFQNPSVPKTYSVGFNHDLGFNILCKKNQETWLVQRNLGSKLKTIVKLLGMTGPICFFYRCLPACIKSA